MRGGAVASEPKKSTGPKRPDLKLVTRILIGVGVVIAVVVIAIVYGAPH